MYTSFYNLNKKIASYCYTGQLLPAQGKPYWPEQIYSQNPGQPHPADVIPVQTEVLTWGTINSLGLEVEESHKWTSKLT